MRMISENEYVPISFSKSCKVVVERGWGMYFHCTHTLSPEGTKVEPFPGFTPEVKAMLTKASDYGIVQLTLDGKSVGKPIDCYDPRVTNTDEISLGAHQIESGKHTLKATVIGSNPRATNYAKVGTCVFGIDYLRLKTRSSD